MAINMMRMTIYAFLSSIETDIRNVIINYVTSLDESHFPIKIKEKCCERRNSQNQINDKELCVSDIVDYLDFKESIEIILRNKDEIPDYIYNYIKANESLITELIPIRNRIAHSRPLEIDDLPRTLSIVDSLLTGFEAEIFQSLLSTKQKVKEDPLYVCSLTIPENKEPVIFNNLPIPEFEETGFIGRKDILSNTIKMCLGPWPVISLIGDGGLGKTAIALKAAYDLIYMENCPFEAIIWTSSKTSQLTIDEIKRIENSISTSVGMFSNVSNIIGSTENSDAMKNILEFMKYFKVLLIIDNLETILDESIYSFLSELPNGSKILITSRIGLGIEYKIKVEPLTSKESIVLLKALASIRNIHEIMKFSNLKLEDYCKRMNNNPGFIKWFVSAMVSGKRPEEILANSAVFLDYCMSNVYRFLEEISRNVLRSMLCIPRELSQAELSYINDLDSFKLKTAMQQLTTTNMVVMKSIARGSSFESKFEITEFARSYLAKHHPVKNEEFKKYKQKQNQLQSDSEELNRISMGHPYAPLYIAARSNNDHVLIRILVDAVNKSKLKDFEAAKKQIDEAKSLDPGYFEVKRIEATIAMFEGLTSYANDCFQASIELDPKQSHVRYWYAMFLVKYLGENEEAIEQLNKAEIYDLDRFEIKFEKSKVLMYLKRYNDSILILKELLDDNLTSQRTTMVYDLLIQNNYRKAEDLLLANNYIQSIESYSKAFEMYKSCPEEYKDQAMMKIFDKSSYSISKLVRYSQTEEYGYITDSLLPLVELKESFNKAPVVNNWTKKLEGSIYHFVKQNGYGFINDDTSGMQLFFHVSNLMRQSDLLKLKVTSKVKYVKIINEKNKEEAILIERVP